MPDKLLDEYVVRPDRYDELLAGPGEPRPHWDAFLHALAERSTDQQITDVLTLTERQIRDHGITYNVYADPQGADRPWEVDPLPLLISAQEWAEIESGIAQRADLLNRVLADFYGPQRLLREGLVPPSIVFGHSGYLHQVHGIRPQGGLHLFQYAADLARSSDGRWWVVGDRTQAPSGAGYALENRLVVSRVFPQMFRELGVQHLAVYFAALRDSIVRLAPRDDGADHAAPPLIALLTPGPYNETYFEHALVARYLGFTLVEGSDLTVRGGRVWLKTIEGLKRVHAIVRRQDDNYCDPLELRSDSALGVAGLTDCARRGTVMIANALGSGVLESGALLGYLPRLSQHLLGEPLRLPSVATWWLGEPAAFADAWSQLDRVIIKALDRSHNENVIFGADLDAKQRERLRAQIALHPHRYVAQEWVRLSQAPVLERERERERSSLRGGLGAAETMSRPPNERLAAHSIGLRVFAVATEQGWHVMPGGLTRVAAVDDARMIAMQRGGRSKDTWVLSDGPVNAAFSLLRDTVTAEDVAAPRASLPSRAAENLYWFGRYGERCDNTARVLRVAVSRVLGDAEELDDGSHPALALARRLGLVDSDEDPEVELLRAATHPDAGLAAQLRQLARVAFNLRERMSADNWRSLNQLIADPVFQRGASLPLALAWLDRAVTSMVTLSGFVMDGMVRSKAWRFLSIGRRLERMSNLTTMLTTAIEDGRSNGLDWLLDLGDSAVTYRSRYLVQPEWMPVLDLLLRDATNPRSIAFQLKGLTEYVERLEHHHGRFASDLLAPARQMLATLEPADLAPESQRLAQTLAELGRLSYRLSDALTQKFFTHAGSRSMLSLVA